MKAMMLTAFGGPENLALQDVPEPHAGPGQVRVRIEAIGINPVEYKVREGWLQQVMPVTLPAVLGADVAGTVDQVGPDVEGFTVGDRVAGFVETGAYAEAALARPGGLLHIPDGMDVELAAALPLVAETAQRALAPLHLQPGETAVVNGAAGGVGTVAVQLLTQAGVTVIGTSSPGNFEYLRRLGAVPVEYGEGVIERIRAAAPRGVDAVFDAAGYGFAVEAMALRGGPDRIVTIADFGAPAHGILLSGASGDGQSARSLLDIYERAAQGTLTMPIARTFAFEDLAAAQTMSQHGHHRGKIVVRGVGRSAAPEEHTPSA